MKLTAASPVIHLASINLVSLPMLVSNVFIRVGEVID
jgi:hypothetical protein